MEGRQVGVNEQTNKVSLGCFLERTNGPRLKPNVFERCNGGGNLPDESLERELSDQEVGGLLVPPDLTESNRARSVSWFFFDLILQFEMVMVNGTITI